MGNNCTRRSGFGDLLTLSCECRETLKCHRMKDATHIWEWQRSKRMRNTEKKRTGGNWGRCEGFLRRFHLVGRKCNVLFYRQRRTFFSFYRFTSDILSFRREVLEYKISHWKWSCEYRQWALCAHPQTMLNLRKMFKNRGKKKTQNIKRKQQNILVPMK